MGSLQFNDVEYSFERQLLEVEAIAGVVIGRDGLGIVIDHDGAVAGASQRIHCVDGAPVELDRGADPVGTPTQHHEGSGVSRYDVVGRSVVGHVKEIGLRWILCCQCIDLLHHRTDSQFLTPISHIECGLITGRNRICSIERTSDLVITESQFLGTAQQRWGKFLERVVLDLLLTLCHLAHSLQEPWCDLGQRVNLFHTPAALECLSDGEDSLLRGNLEQLVKIVLLEVISC